jgi:hypothetical protein
VSDQQHLFGPAESPRPYRWLLQLIPAADRDLADRVLRVEWPRLRCLKGRRAIIQATIRHVRRAKANPESLTWAENRRAREWTDVANAARDEADAFVREWDEFQAWKGRRR